MSCSFLQRLCHDEVDAVNLVYVLPMRDVDHLRVKIAAATRKGFMSCSFLQRLCHDEVDAVRLALK